MTVLEALRQSVDTLNRVNIPVALIQQIGMPVQQAIGLIQASLGALERDAMQQPKEDRPEEPKQKEDGPDDPEEEDSTAQDGRCYAASEDALNGNPPAVSENDI